PRPAVAHRRRAGPGLMAGLDGAGQPRPRVCRGTASFARPVHARGAPRLLGRGPARRGLAGLIDNNGVAHDVVMPDLQGAEEITIGAWSKKVGDHVNEGETLLEALTDKVNAEIPSPVSGVVEELLLDEGASVKPGQTIARVATKP